MIAAILPVMWASVVLTHCIICVIAIKKSIG